MVNGNEDFSRSVGAVVIRTTPENKKQVLLARHTYGAGKGRLIIPGGYINKGESPEDAVIREVLEETKVNAVVSRFIGVRFSEKDWYCVFRLEYLSGNPVSDHDENSEAVFIDIEEVDNREDIAELSKILIHSALETDKAFLNTPFHSTACKGKYSLYTVNNSGIQHK